MSNLKNYYPLFIICIVIFSFTRLTHRDSKYIATTSESVNISTPAKLKKIINNDLEVTDEYTVYYDKFSKHFYINDVVEFEDKILIKRHYITDSILLENYIYSEK